MVDIKYEAEISLEAYWNSVAMYNKEIERAEKDYIPWLNKMQALEDRWISFIKHIMDKIVNFMKSTSMQETTLTGLDESITLINSETDI